MMAGIERAAVEVNPYAHRAQRILRFLQSELPEAFAEGQFDPAVLRVVLGEPTEDRPERYLFSWAGKREAINLLRLPTRATLVPAPDESVNFDSTQNLFIEGDNLEVLKLLYRAYFGRVKMIYIDPPYNTGNDFIYPDNFADPLARYLEMTGQQDAEGNLTTSNPERAGRYHSTWLSMMYPRLFLARQLLRDDGVLLVSIDDGEVANLKILLNEIFGEENFVAHILWQKRYVSNATAQYLSDMHDHILVYARNKGQITVQRLARTAEQLRDYKNPDNDERGDWRPQDLSASKPYSAGLFTITGPTGREFNPPPGRYWRCNLRQYEEWLADNRIWFGKEGTGRPMLKAFLDESQAGVTPNTWWTYEFAGHNKEATLELKKLFDGAAPFDTPKPVKLVKRMLELFADSEALVLDFFAGSCTTAHAVIEQNRDDGGNRRFVMIQLPEPTGHDDYRTIADIGKERMRRVFAGVKQEAAKQLPLETSEDRGFRVFKLAKSNLRSWPGLDSPTPQDYAAQLALFNEQLADDAEAANIIWEVAIKEGFPLTAQIAPVRTVTTNAVYQVFAPGEDRSFFICLDTRLNDSLLDALPLTKTDLFVCRDSALTDTIAANLAQQCELRTL